jgi:hypothetical protein
MERASRTYEKRRIVYNILVGECIVNRSIGNVRLEDLNNIKWLFKKMFELNHSVAFNQNYYIR